MMLKNHRVRRVECQTTMALLQDKTAIDTKTSVQIEKSVLYTI
jgi:hypothetical protein